MKAIVAGAGLAGLVAARTLHRAGWEVIVLEAADGVGGRVRTDVVDGFRLDRGFQVLFTAYPAAQRQLDLKALKLRQFDHGAIVVEDHHWNEIGDPRQDPKALIPTLLSTVPLLSDKLKVLKLARELRRGSFRRSPETSSAEFLRAPDRGPVRLVTEVVKVGRTASVVRVALSQHERLTMTATVTAGRLPSQAPVWSDLPVLAPEPPPDALATSEHDENAAPLSRACDVRLDPAGFRREGAGAVLRGWVRPVGEPVDVLFALLAGDILPPVVVNVGRPGWAPTVQLSALLRARPAPGWLRLVSESRVVAGSWFDEDMTVIDSAGRLVCQARQLALSPLG